MGIKKPIDGYACRTDAIMALTQQGKSLQQISDALDIPAKTVAALRHSGLRRKNKWAQGERITKGLRKFLLPHAERRNVTVDRLIVAILATVAGENLVDAVLDDSNEHAAGC